MIYKMLKLTSVLKLIINVFLDEINVGIHCHGFVMSIYTPNVHRDSIFTHLFSFFGGILVLKFV